MEWISVDERLPDKSHYVESGLPVAHVLVSDGISVSSGFYHEGFWGDMNGDSIDNITHWMPLPEPPEEAVSNE